MIDITDSGTSEPKLLLFFEISLRTRAEWSDVKFIIYAQYLKMTWSGYCMKGVRWYIQRKNTQLLNK